MSALLVEIEPSETIRAKGAVENSQKEPEPISVDGREEWHDSQGVSPSRE